MSSLKAELEPFFKFSKIFGFSPYSRSADEVVGPGLSRIGIVYSGVCSIAYSSLVYVRFANTINTRGDKKLLFLTIFRTILVMFVIIIDILLCVTCHRKLRASVSHIERYDRAVASTGARPLPRPPINFTRSFIGVFLIVVYYALIAWLTYTGEDSSASLEDSIVYFVYYTSLTSSIVKFSAIALSLRRRFRHLNDTMRSKSLCWSRDPTIGLIGGGDWCRRQLRLRDVCCLHSFLLTAARQLNSLYSAQLLLWIAALTFNLTSRLYVFSKPVETLNVWKVYRDLGMAIASVLLLTVFTCICHTTALEANRIGSASFSPGSSIFRSKAGQHDFTNNSKSSQEIQVSSQDNVQAGLYFLFHRLNFSAAFGLVKVELPLLQTIAGAIMTYLVILKSSA